MTARALARIFVDDLAAALPLYRALADDAAPRLFEFGDVQLAWVGPFLLLEAPPARRAQLDRAATVLVENMEATVHELERYGGSVLEPPAPGPNGRRMVARHPDGAVLEYIEVPATDR
ncbi:hypothetical protein G9U51_02590 [Calidifontibacter sp. DB0510]|uniref:VOC family protein n=1 Tax=Metallococcus carri TaxID=1656884 RepID=A0A967AYB2_9MICO|nr:hypothetical protein [Metallococcus carri]NHN54669.1 hypothetical protein [Metallococcus carri]NOP37014.1 hypothetical protein [Calidifontibacter sp. DB2511S]